jgi:hypothetical protein
MSAQQETDGPCVLGHARLPQQPPPSNVLADPHCCPCCYHVALDHNIPPLPHTILRTHNTHDRQLHALLARAATVKWCWTDASRAGN